MKKIAIYGAGGFGREVACLIHKINERESEWKLVGFFDDDVSLKGSMISHYAPCLGGIDVLNSVNDDLAVVIAIGNPSAMKGVINRILNPLISFPNIIHPDFKTVDPLTFQIGKGNIIQGGCYASCDVKIGDFNVLNGSDVLGHDVILGNFNSLMPAVRVSGKVHIGDDNFFGVGSIVLQGVHIGHGISLSAGSVLLTKPQNGLLYMGNPAKKIVF